VSKIQVKFVKEVEADLNAYYESFPKSLRTQIDDALYALLGGQKPKRKSPSRPPRVLKDSKVFRITSKASHRIGSKTAAAMSDLRRLNGGDVVNRAEIFKVAEQHGMQKGSVINNLVAKGYLVPVN
jgi:hypothetical protein